MTSPVEPSNEIPAPPAPLVYDLKAMAMYPGPITVDLDDPVSLAKSFWFDATPQGIDYWRKVAKTGHTAESRQFIADMLAQQERENGTLTVETLEHSDMADLRDQIATLTAERERLTKDWHDKYRAFLIASAQAKQAERDRDEARAALAEAEHHLMCAKSDAKQAERHMQSQSREIRELKTELAKMKIADHKRARAILSEEGGK